MTDPRIETLARNLIGFSCNVQRGENVLIETYGDCDALLLALIRETYAAGANPDRKSTRLNSSHKVQSRMPSSA